MKKYSLYILKNNDIKREIISSNSIKDIDNYTKNYIGYYNLLYELGYSKSNRVKLISNKPYYELPIIYSYDYGYINNYDIKDKYYNYLKNNRNYIDRSLIRFVKVGSNIDKYISDDLLLKACNSYFNNRYKAIRDAYYELIRLGIINRVTTNDKENIFKRNFIPDANNEYIDYLLESDDIEGIFNVCDIDDMPGDVYNYITTKRRVLKR